MQGAQPFGARIAKPFGVPVAQPILAVLLRFPCPVRSTARRARSFGWPSLGRKTLL